MQESEWDVFHAGYGASFMIANANYGVPLDAIRQLEKDHAFGRLYPFFYGTTGVEGEVAKMAAMGTDMGNDMKKEGIKGVLMVST